jgi:hypothetical protein
MRAVSCCYRKQVVVIINLTFANMALLALVRSEVGGDASAKKLVDATKLDAGSKSGRGHVELVITV